MKYYKLVKQIHTNHLLYVIISEDLRCYLKYYAYLCKVKLRKECNLLEMSVG